MDDESNAIIRRQGPDQKTWYVVAHAPDMATAAIPAGLLKNAHIPVFMFREAAGSSAIPLSYGLLGGVDVAVPEEYYPEAAALLDEDTSSDELSDGFDDSDEDWEDEDNAEDDYSDNDYPEDDAAEDN